MKMNHDLEDHVKRLHTRCRVCGNKTYFGFRQFRNRGSFCSTYRNKLFELFHLDIDTDEDWIHSKTICRACVMCLRRHTNNLTTHKTERLRRIFDETQKLWTVYKNGMNVEECKLCSIFYKHKKGRAYEWEPTDSCPSSSQTTQKPPFTKYHQHTADTPMKTVSIL